MSVNSKKSGGSSADEFYDAVESMDEISSSPIRPAASLNNASLGSIEERGGEDAAVDQSVEVENIGGLTGGVSKEDDAGSGSVRNGLSRGFHRDNSSMDENWASCRSLLDNTPTPTQQRGDGALRGSAQQENSENWASARCVLENVPSLMDVVSSSVSNDELDRGEVKHKSKKKVENKDEKSSGDSPSDRLTDSDKVSGESHEQLDSEAHQSLDSIERVLEAETQQPSESHCDNENGGAIGDCCTAIDQINLSEHELVDMDDIVETAEVDNQDVIYSVNTEEMISSPQQQTNIILATLSKEASIAKLDVADVTGQNRDEVHFSQEDSSCFDRESDNGFLPVNSDSISTTNTSLLTPRRTKSESAEVSVAESNFSTPLHQSARDCSMLDFCDLSSPLEALYLICSNAERGGSMLKRESMQDLLNDISNAASPERMSCSHDVDPKGPAPMSPTEDRNAVPETDSDDDSSSAASFSSVNKKFRIVDKDTGNIFDVREVMKDIDEVGESMAFDTKYSFLPSKRELQRRTVVSGSTMEDDDDERSHGPAASFDSISSAPLRDSTRTATSSNQSHDLTPTRMKTKLSDIKSSIKNKIHKSTINRKRTASTDSIPRNAIHVKSTSRQHQATTKTASPGDSPQGKHVGSSSFNPMLLVKTIPKSHDGPAWCAAFSLDGRFLATGGEDGNVCIWAVAPQSTAVHPKTGGTPANGVKKGDDSSKAQESEVPDQVDIQSPPAKDGNGTEKVSIDTTPAEEAIPSLNTVGTGPELATNLDIISSEPLQRFKDHTADVIDLSWSHTNFLLTASLDSSVRLYHYSKSTCLHLFKHANLVASVDFHPKDERFFISGGIDKKLRLWSITDGRVKDWAQAPDVITAVRFTPDGKYAVAGLFRGQVYFYDSDGLKYYTQIACRNRSGRYKMGRKVTGISFVRGERDDWKRSNSVPESEASSTLETSFTKLTEAGSRVVKRISLPFKGNAVGEDALRYTERMLVSTNDSRVRLYGLNDFCLVRKYKGHANFSMQIRARISESGDYIACGSESGHVFLWKTLDKEWMAKHNINTKLHKTKDKAKSSAYFEASKAQLPIVTDALFFPYQSVKEALLSSQLFPFQLSMDRVGDDLSSAAILSLDYDGTMRVFLRKSCIDNLLDAATPRGGHLA